MNRVPPLEIRKILRKEVGFGCPIPGCGNPYLYWHHFDPPWSERQHHNPEGMIALCGIHHPMADKGAYTVEQLKGFKKEAQLRTSEIKGRFDWMRNKLLAVVGGNFYFETPIVFQYKEQPVIWFRRDEEGYLLLNIRMLTISREHRLVLEDNYWLSSGNLDDLESPPSGKLLKAVYPNGDELKVQFLELQSMESVRKQYPDSTPEGWPISFPITAIEVTENVAGTNICFGPRETRFGGITMRNCFFAYCGVGLGVG